MNTINEKGVYRSPKWLRNFIDYEVHTGEDIKGKVSKRELKERREKEWNSFWSNIDTSEFRDFYKDFQKKINSKSIYFYSSELEGLARKDCDNGIDIFGEFEKYLKEKKEKKDKEKKIINDINNLYDSISNDFYKNPYIDKFSSRPLIYKFENGDTFQINDFLEMKFTSISKGITTTYTISWQISNRFFDLINRIISVAKKRPSAHSNSSGSSSGGSSSGGSSSGNRSRYNNTDPNNKEKINNKYSNHPKGKLYQTLKDTISQREAQLKSMSKNHPDRESLENELRNAKTRLEDMKIKYKFEHLNNFYKFSSL